MAIRYDKKINSEINRIVNNYNSKIRRLSKTNKAVYIPERITKSGIKDLKESVTNRADLRRRLKELQRYSERGGEQIIKVKGVSISRSQYKTLTSYKRLATLRINRKLKFFEENKPTSSGIEQAGTFKQLRTQEYLNTVAKKEALLGKDLSTLTSDREINEYINKLKVNTRTFSAKDWQHTYVEDIFTTAGYILGIDKKTIDKISKKFESLTPAQFNKLVSQEALLKSIQEIYEGITNAGIKKTKKFYENADEIYNNLEENIDNLISKIKEETPI